jgi:hypothetical protein
MRLGWRKLLPTSLANILITGVFVLAVASAGESVQHALLVLSDSDQAAAGGCRPRGRHRPVRVPAATGEEAAVPGHELGAVRG